MTNVLYSLSRHGAGARLADAGDRSSGSTTSARGLFVPVARPEPKRTPALTWTALSPLALPDLPEAIGRRLVEEHLLDADRFWLPVPPPSVSAADPKLHADGPRLPAPCRYWRGPTWINTAWLVWLGLLRLGYDERSRDAGGARRRRGPSEGLREYYNPFTGAGMGATEFGWSSLVLELTEPDRRASSSYLTGDPTRTG